MTYATVDDVLNFLFITFEQTDNQTVVNRFKQWIQDRINEFSAVLEEKCRTCWATPKTTKETIHRNWSVQFRTGRVVTPFYVRWKPLKTVNYVKIDSPSGYILVPPEDYIIDEYGIYLKTKSSHPLSVFGYIEVEYTYGYNYIPADIKGAVIRMTARELLNTANYQSFLSRIPNADSIKEWEKYTMEVIRRWSFPQVLP